MNYNEKNKKRPLYRKVNSKVTWNYHNNGPDFKHERNKKNPDTSMKKGKQRGLDYTPLFKFLLSKIGKDWDVIYKEAITRLDKTDPIWWIVGKTKDSHPDIIRVDESSYYTGLYIDENNLLQKINPECTFQDLFKNGTWFINCYTYSFNGKTIPRQSIPKNLKS